MDVASVGLLKETRRVSDPDKAQIIWDGIKVKHFSKLFCSKIISFSDCQSSEADSSSAKTVKIHEQELQARQGNYSESAQPRCGGQSDQAAQEGGDQG